MSVIRNSHKRDYTCFGNDVLRFTHVPMEERPSLRARGLLHMMLSYPPDWKFNGLEEIISEVPEGRDAVRAAFAELKQLGYASRVRVIDPKTRQTLRWETVVSETPHSQGSGYILASELEAKMLQGTENPSSGNQITEKPSSGKPRRLENQRVEGHTPGISGPLINNDQQSIEELNTEELSTEEIAAGAIAHAPTSQKEGNAEPEQPKPPASQPASKQSSARQPKGLQGADFSAAPPRSSAAELIYKELEAMGRLETFSTFWDWYRGKVCAIAPSNPGSKAAAASSWLMLERGQFLGVGYEAFKQGCLIEWQKAIATKGVGVPHACRFLLPTKTDPSWLESYREQQEKPNPDQFLGGNQPEPTAALVFATPEDVGKAIRACLNELDLPGFLPPDLARHFGFTQGVTVGDLNEQQQREYLTQLQKLVEQRKASA